MPAALLLLDVGNTRVKWAAVSARGRLRPQGEILTAQVTPSWMASWSRKHAGRRLIVASVVPSITGMLRRHWKEAVCVGGTLPGLPLHFDYPQPAEIGADRIAAAVGAQAQGPAIIVGCGTATAISVLDSQGRFCGGVIAPGPEAQLRALRLHTALLPPLALRPVRGALGRSTEAAMRAGVMLQFQGGVREIVEHLRRKVGASAGVLITGGNARYLKGMTSLGSVEFRPLLVFEGLRIIGQSLPQP